MGRGYSASRSKSGRPTLRSKRSRSMSIHALKQNVEATKQQQQQQSSSTSARTASSSSSAAPTEVRRTLKVIRQRPAPQRDDSVSAKKKKQQQKNNNHKSASNEEDDTEESVAQQQQQGNSSRSATAASTRTRSQSLMVRRNLAALEAAFDDAMEGSDDEENTIANPNVMTKYKECGRVVDAVLDELHAACVEGAHTKDLCDAGDDSMKAKLKPLYGKVKDPQTGKKIPRGIAFPTNISVNEVLCNDAPFHKEEGAVLKVGDVVKIHLGCHLDGFPVSAARTVVVLAADGSDAGVVPTAATAADEEQQQHNNNNTNEIGFSSNKKNPASIGNTIEAARVALQGLVHQLQPGALNADLTDFIAKVGHHYEVNAVEGVLSNRTKRWVPDGMDCIIARRVMMADPHQDVADCSVRAQQVWCLDVAFTNCESYRIALSEKPTTIFRRNPAEFAEDARVQQANATLSEITEHQFCFPFHFKELEHPLKAKMGVNVLVKKGVVDRLPCLRTKAGYVTARFSATVAVSGRKLTVLCGAPAEAPVPVPTAMRASVQGLSGELAEALSMPLDFALAQKMAAKQAEPARKRVRVEGRVAAAEAKKNEEEE